MPFMDEYRKALNKDEEDEKKKKQKEKQKSSPFMDEYRISLATMEKEENIAPVYPTVSKSTQEDERTWFQKGALEDGITVGNIAKTILGTITDTAENIGSVIMGMGESALDALAYLGNAAAKGQYYQNGGGFNIAADQAFEQAHKESTKATEEFIKKDLYDEESIAKAIISDRMKSLTGIDAEADSVFGEKADSLVQSVGQLLATAVLQKVGVPWFLTTGATSFGSEAENALNQGASYHEAGASAAISAGAEIISEKLSGGIKFGGKALDDAMTKRIASGISNKLGRTLAKLGMDMAGEGAEEVFSQAASNLGSALYKEENVWELLTNEEAFDGYLEAFIGGAALGGVAGSINAIKANKNGVDYATELTTNEKAVVDKVFQDRLAEESGEVSKKKKAAIYEQVMDDLDKGYIDTDTIESVLAEEKYKPYKEALDEESSIREEMKGYQAEYDTLSKKESLTLEETVRKNELTKLYADAKAKLDDADRIGKRDYLKAHLDQEVYEMTKGDRLRESFFEQVRGKQKFQADVTKYKGRAKEVIQRVIDSGLVDNTNRMHEFWDAAAKISEDKGIDISVATNDQILDMLEEEAKADGREFDRSAFEGKIIDGVWTKKGIVLNPQSKRSLNFIVGHEITHSLEANKDVYGALQKVLFSYGAEEYQKRFNARAGQYKNIYTDDKFRAKINQEVTADMVGDYLFTDFEFVRHLSTKNRNVFQKIWDEVKYLYKVATAGSREARELEKVKRAFEKAYREANKAQGKAKLSLDMVDAVQPKSDKWSRTHTTEEAMARFPNMWNVAAEESEVRNPTQITSTVNSYRKIYNFLQNEGFNGTILDASSGLGYGTRAGVEEYGFNVEDIEPYPDKGYKPKYQDYSALDKKYDVIISNAVLNVLPQDQRDALAVKMGELLNDGGRLFVNVRGKDVETLAKTGKNIHLGNMEWIETVKGSYQKGFTKPELVAYLQDALGDGFTVKPTNMFGAVSAVVTKDGGAKYSVSDSDGNQLSKEQQEYFKDSKVRDENGNLKVMYHGSQDAGFHVFDARMSDDDTSFFFVDRNDVAASYSGTTETYEAKTIRSAEDMNNFLAEIGYDEDYEVVQKDGEFILLYDGDRVAASDTAQGIYKEFCWYEGVGEGDANYKVYLNLTNPLEVDAEGRNWDNISREYSQEVADRYKSLAADEKAALYDLAQWEDFGVFKDAIRNATDLAAPTTGETEILASAYYKLEDKQGKVNLYDLFSIASDNFSEEAIKQFAVKQMSTRDYAQRAKEQGYDGVIFKNIHDNGGYSNGSEGASTVAIAFESNQIKSVANEKPTGDADIRYSVSEDSQGHKLSEEQEAFFKDSVIRDKNGSLMPMYHGTKKGGFTVFGGRKDYWYFTNDKKYAYTFEGRKANGQLYPSTKEGIEKGYYNPERYTVYLNVTKPFVTDDVDVVEDALYWDKTLAGKLREQGYDALMLEDMSQVIVLNPNQIKNVSNKKPTSDPDIRYSLSELENAYQYNIDNNDMLGAEMVVERAANLAMPNSKIRGKDGSLTPVYHGTREMFYEFDTSVSGGKNGTAEGFGIYTSDDPGVTEAYGERQIKMYANITKPATSTKRTITASKLAALIKDTCKRQAQQMVADGEHDSVREALLDTWVSNYVYTYGIGMDRAYRETANSILQMNDNDMGIIQEVMAGMGIRDYAEATNFYRNSLTPITGFDGFVTQWENSSTGKKSNIILAFESSQLKSADAVTYDDNGKIIPLTERFDPEKADIRYSISDKGQTFKQYGRWNVYNQLPGAADIAPVPAIETAPAKAAPGAAVPETPGEEAPVTEENLLPDDLAPAGQELENLIAEREQLMGALEAAQARGDANALSQLGAEYETVNARIQELQALENQRLDSLSDADIPPEMDAPMHIEDAHPEDKPVQVEDPFADRDWYDAKNLTSIMEERPDLKPFIMDEALTMLQECSDSTRGERFYNDEVYYESGGEKGWSGVKRHTSEDIAEILDGWNIGWDALESGLRKIGIDGEAKTAVPKKLEFMLNQRLLHGYKDMYTGKRVGPNQAYIAALREHQNLKHYEEERNSFFENADEYAPPASEEDIAPVPEKEAPAPTLAPTEAVNTDNFKGVVNGQESYITMDDKLRNRHPQQGVEAENIAPLFDSTERKGVPEGQQAFIEDAGVPKQITRKELHANIMDRLKASFSAKGFDFDKVLKNAKNLSTFATVDNTPQRVMEKALGYKEGGILADFTVNQVAQNEAKGIQWLNSFTDRKNGMLAQLVEQYGIKPGSKESAAAQMYAEGFYVNEKNEIIKYGDAELAKDFPDIVKQAQIKGLARDKRIRQIYDDTLKAINESRTRNAYPEIPRLDNYFLHFRAMNDTFSKLGLPFNPNDIRAKDLPTDLNGVTADLKPGQPFFASAMHRKGKRTSFDLLGGLEQYLTSAKNQIYHIDDIQNLRALRNYIADTYGQANGLEGLDELSEDEQQQRIEQVYGSHLSTFAKFLNEEANVLAGKTALIDRGVEGIIGRRGMTFLDTVNKQVGSNMVGYNVSSALTNFIAPVQALAKTNKAAFIKGMAQFVSNKVKSINGKGDGFAEQSPVMIRRKGAERFHRTFWQKISDPGYLLMSAVDNVSTELIARAKYNEFVSKNMDSQQAHIETDKWVSRLMGDRSLGQQPQLYNSKMLGLLTKFQLEVRNQLDSQFYDTIQEAKVSNEDIENGLVRNAKTAAKVTSTFVQLAVLQHVFGKAFESVAGYNPAFDIISAIIKTIGLDDDEESEDTVLDNIEQGFFELMEDMPYYSTFSGGRIPIESALPIKEFVKGEDKYGNDKPRWKTLLEAAPYYALPGGYGQIKKTVAGLNMFSDDHPIAGSYTDSGNLRFPVDDTLGSRVKAAIFGQYASDNARKYFDEEHRALNPEQAEVLEGLGIPVEEYWEYRDSLDRFYDVKDQLEETSEAEGATTEDILKSRYYSAVSSSLSDLYAKQKEIASGNSFNKQGQLRALQEQMNEMLAASEHATDKMYVTGHYAEVGDRRFNYDGEDAKWYEIKETNSDGTENYYYKKEQEVTQGLGISYEEYWSKREEYNYAYDKPEQYALSQAVGGYESYRGYTSELWDIKADKDENGKSISGSRKEKVIDYLNNLDIDYYHKIILFKNEYNADDTYNQEIIDYLNSNDDISYEEMATILKYLGFDVDEYGNISW